LIAYLEDLSCLTLSEEEKVRLSGDMEAMLRAMAPFYELDVESVPECKKPFDRFNHMNAFREDVIQDSLDREWVLRNAPERNEEMFIAPRAVD